VTSTFFAFDTVDEDPGGPRGGRRRSRRLLPGIVLLVILVLGGLYVAAFVFSSDRLPRGTVVAGVDLGGQRPEQAEVTLRDALRDKMSMPIDVVVGDRKFRINPERAGLEVDIPASVAQVPVGRSWNPADMWEEVVGGTSYEPVVVTVDDLLHKRMQKIADAVDEAPVDGAVTFTGDTARPTYPEQGSELDVDAATDAVRAAYLHGSAVSLDLQPVDGDVTSAAVSRAMERFANPAMAAPVTLSLDGEQARLQPSEFATALSMESRNGRLVPQVDGDVLLDLVKQQLPLKKVDPVDATVRIRGGKPVVVPARKGLAPDADALEKVFLDLVATTGGPRRAELPTKGARPDVTTADARKLGIRQLVSEFTTYYPRAHYRNVNIGRAASLIDGTVLAPGETFSLNGTVGERSRDNGFTKGWIISDGVYAKDFGGGVSQVATTTFNAAFFAGLEDVEHHPHSFYIDRYPVGREATVAWPDVDLKFRDDTKYGVLIQTIVRPSTAHSRGALTVRMWSTKVWDIRARTGDRYGFTKPSTRHLSGPGCEPNKGYAGFQIDVTRVFRKHGHRKIDHAEGMHTTYQPSDTVVCRP